MPMRFDRWMRSKLSAITARTPRRAGPLAAQSREDPEPYSLPAMTTSGTSFGLVADGGLEDRHLLAVGKVRRHPAFGTGHEVVADAGVRRRSLGS